MPRSRPRRRRNRKPAAAPQANAAITDAEIERIEQSPRRGFLPTASVVTAMGLGIWAGWTFTSIGGIVENVALWIGVLMAGLGGGRLFRRSFQARRERRR